MKKSSTNKKDTGKLEDVFRQAFEGAEERPPADLWGRIDQQLQSGQTTHYRERMLWYRQLAAACLVLLVGLGAFTYYLYRTGNGADPQLAMQQQAPAPPGAQIPEAAPSTDPNETDLAAASRSGRQDSPRGDGPSTAPSPHMAEATGGQQAKPTPSRPTGSSRGTGLVAGTKRPARPAATPNANIRDEALSEGEPPSMAALPAKGRDREVAPSRDEPAQTAGADPALAAPMLAKEENQRVLEAKESPSMAAKEGETLIEGQGGEQTQPLPRSLALQPEREQDKVALSANRQELEELLPSALRRSKWSVSSGYGAQYFAQNISLRNDFYGASRGMLTSASPSNFAGNAALTTYDKAVDEFIQNTRPAHSFGAAVKAGYQLDRFWRVETGFIYSHNESQTRTSYLVTGMNILTNPYLSSLSNADLDVQESFRSVAAMPSATIMLPALAGLDDRFVSVNKTDDFTTRYRYRYVGVPLLLGFQSRESRSFIFATAGVIPQVLVQSSIIPESPLASRVDFSVGQDSPFRKWNVSASASAGYGYRLSDELSLSVGPELQYFFAPLIRSSGITHIRQGNPYNVGVNLSARYTLKR